MDYCLIPYILVSFSSFHFSQLPHDRIDFKSRLVVRGDRNSRDQVQSRRWDAGRECREKWLELGTIWELYKLRAMETSWNLSK